MPKAGSGARKTPSGAKGVPTPRTPKAKAVARRAVTPAIRQQYRDTYGAGFKKNPATAAAFQSARKAAVKKQMGGK